MKKKILALFLVIAAAIPMFTSCADTTWIFTVDGEKVPAGIYLYYMYTTKLSLMNEADISDDENVKSYLDVTKDGVSASEYASNLALTETKKLIAVEKECAERGLTVSEDDQQIIESYLSSMDTDNMNQMGVSTSSLRRILTSSFLQEALFMDIYGEEGEKAIPTDELTSKFEEEYVRIKHVLISIKDEDEMTITDEDQLAELESTANQVLDKMKAATTDTEVVELIKEYNDDPGMNDEDRQRTGYIFTKENSGMVEEYETAAKEMEIGEVRMIKSDTYGWFIMKRYDLFEADAETEEDRLVYFEDYRMTLMNELKGEEFETVLDEMAAAVEIEENKAAFDRYTLKKVKVD